MSNNWIERVKKEQKELQEKIDKLEVFVNSKEFYKVDMCQRRLMLSQLRAMETYNTILISRIYIEKIS